MLFKHMFDMLQWLQSSKHQFKDSAATEISLKDYVQAIDFKVLEHLRLAQMLKKRNENKIFIELQLWGVYLFKLVSDN